MKSKRRVFYCIIAVCPLVSCGLVPEKQCLSKTIDIKLVSQENASRWLPSNISQTNVKETTLSQIKKNCCFLKKSEKKDIDWIFSLPDFREKFIFVSSVESRDRQGRVLVTTSQASVDGCGKFISILKETHFKEI